jgi:hypothetical protein
VGAHHDEITAGKILVVGGYSAYDNSTSTASGEVGTAEIYDIGTDTWSAAASLPSSDTQADICATYSSATGEVFINGNYTGTSMAASTQRYNVSGDSWGASISLVDITNTSQSIEQSCGTHTDGRPWFVGNERGGYLQIINLAPQIQYSASQGDGAYTFSITAGTGTLDSRNVFTPAFPLVPATDCGEG